MKVCVQFRRTPSHLLNLSYVRDLGCVGTNRPFNRQLKSGFVPGCVLDLCQVEYWICVWCRTHLGDVLPELGGQRVAETVLDDLWVAPSEHPVDFLTELRVGLGGSRSAGCSCCQARISSRKVVEKADCSIWWGCLVWGNPVRGVGGARDGQFDTEFYV